MMRKDEQLKKVLADYAAGRLSAKETKKLEHLILKYPVGDAWDWKDNAHREAMKARIKAGIEAQGKAKARVRWINIPVAAAIAAALACFFIFLYLYLSQIQPITYYPIAQAKHYVSDEVLLIGPDGKQLQLGASASFADVKEKLALQNTADLIADSVTIKVPSQKQFDLTLEDGTKVWLNAGATFKFPTTFTKQTVRTVALDGEGYFEVSSDKKHPFLVIAGGTEVKVTGTKFNVQAFAEENLVKTSLMEGVVTFYMDHNAYKLTPGLEVIADTKGKEVRSQAFDTDNLLAWKEGYFVFDNMELVDVMKTVSRWYNISVVSNSPVRNKKIGGTFPKNVPLIDFLKDLTILSGVKFKINRKEVQIIN